MAKNSVTAQRFFLEYADGVIRRLRMRKLIVGKPTLVEGTRQNSFKAHFLFLDQWQIAIEFEFDGGGGALKTLILRAHWLEGKNENFDGRHYEFHFHPGLRDEGKWECLDTYENGPHLHLGLGTPFKIACEDDTLRLDAFLSFISGRHHAKRHEAVTGIPGSARTRIVGLRTSVKMTAT